MFECPENHNILSDKKGKGTRDYLRRYREAKQNLEKRADSLKGKDEPRRRKLLRSAEKMSGKAMSTEQIRRRAAIAEVELLIDECEHREKKHVKK